MIRNIEVLGQAVKGLSEQTRSIEPEVPWREIAGMRDKLIHEYFGVDVALVWDVVERDLPAVLPRIQGLLERLGPQATIRPWKLALLAASGTDFA